MVDEERQPEAAAPIADAAPPEAPLGLDVDDLLAAGAQRATIELPQTEAPPAEVAEGDEPEVAEPDADGGEVEVEAGAPAGEPPAASTPDAIFDYTKMVLSAPQRINEVPGRLRADVIREATAAAYQRGLADAAQQISSGLSAEEALRSFVQTHEDQRTQDPDAFNQWQTANPREAAAFWDGKNRFAERAAAAVPPEPRSPADIQQRALQRLPRIDRLPAAAAAAIRTAVDAGRFPLTEAGLEALDQAILDAATAPVAAEPAVRAPNPREVAAATRAAAPRAVGVGAGGGAPSKDIGWDVDELFNTAAIANSRRSNS